jgi:hypothetical protein
MANRHVKMGRIQGENMVRIVKIRGRQGKECCGVAA